ncbi:MAG: hypothetical protein ACR2QF_03010 [Geminicoccaceae bacterium]
MALILADLKCMDPCGKSRTFKYISDDTDAVIAASAYFDGAVSPAVHLRKGDTIITAADQDGTPSTATLTVSSATGVTPVTTA